MTENKNTDAKSNSQNTALSSIVTSYFPVAPVPLNKPSVDKNFSELPTIERVTEALRYNFLSIEYSISPRGGLRQWLKINLSLFLLLGIPIIVFVPLGTFLMGGFANISGQFANVTQLLLVAATNILKLIGVTLIIGTILYIIFKLLSHRFLSRAKGSIGSKKGDFINVPPNDNEHDNDQE